MKKNPYDLAAVSNSPKQRYNSMMRSDDPSAVKLRHKLYPSRGAFYRFKGFFGLAVPETTLLCFELLFLRTHNINSLKFDFATYLLQCIEKNSSEMLGMSPGRWAWV